MYTYIYRDLVSSQSRTRYQLLMFIVIVIDNRGCITSQIGLVKKYSMKYNIRYVTRPRFLQFLQKL